VRRGRSVRSPSIVWVNSGNLYVIYIGVLYIMLKVEFPERYYKPKIIIYWKEGEQTVVKVPIKSQYVNYNLIVNWNPHPAIIVYYSKYANGSNAVEQKDILNYSIPSINIICYPTHTQSYLPSHRFPPVCRHYKYLPYWTRIYVCIY